MILLGQISWSFNGTDVSAGYRELHRSFGFMDVIVPDFISYKLEEIGGNTELEKVLRDKKVPLLAWTAHTEADVEKARLLHAVPIAEGDPASAL